AYAYYYCENNPSTIDDSVLCYVITSNLFNVSNFKSNITKYSYETALHYNNNPFRYTMFSIKDDKNLFIVFSDFDRKKTYVSFINKKYGRKQKIGDFIYRDKFLNPNDGYEKNKIKLRRLLLF